jgi:putative zinc finger/helix-turn-helix YgiT family protein
MTMAVPLEQQRCHVCRQRTLRREQRPYEYAVGHDGRPPVAIRIPDLELIVCTNPDCHPEHPDDTIILDDAAIWRITEETYRQLGLLTPAEIRAGREKLGLNQQELQRLLGLGGNSLSRWENGRVYQSRSMDVLLRIVFNVPAVRPYLETARNNPRSSPLRHRGRFRYVSADRPDAARESHQDAYGPAEFLMGVARN